MKPLGCPVSRIKLYAGLLFFLPFLPMCELGDSPLAPKIAATDSPDTLVRPDSVNNFMKIRATKSTLRASYNDSTGIEVTVVDGSHNPLSGKEVRFSADGGTVSSKDTSDEQGIARAVFTAEPVNRNITIQATMKHNNTNVRVATTVTLTGISLDVTPRLGSAPLGTTVPVTITLLDGMGAPIADRPVAISGNGDSTKTTDGRGETVTAVQRTTPGTVTIVARALGAVDSTFISFGSSLIDSTNRYMRVRATPSILSAAYGEHAAIEVSVFDDNRNPVTGKAVRFSASGGTVTAIDTTDSNGIATADYTGEPRNGNIAVIATMNIGDSTITAGATVTLKGMVLSVVPSLNVAPPGTVVPVKIKLLDGKGNPVPDRQVTISGNGDSTATTNGAGEVATRATSATAGTIKIYASALGASDSTTITFGTSGPVSGSHTIRSLRLFTSHSQLRADNSDKATITAVLISADDHNPLIGETIRFSSNLGAIDASGTTDSTGRTTVTLRSAPVNGTCTIRAVLSGDTDIADSTTVLFSGVTLELSADRDNAMINDTIVLSALLKDGSGNPISGDFVNFSVTAPGAFQGNTAIFRSAINATGFATVKVSSATAGTFTAFGTSANVADSVRLAFTTNNLSMKPGKTEITIGGSDSTVIAAQYRDLSGNPIEGKTVTFATNAGLLSTTSAITNNSGVAYTYLKSGYFAAKATVQAKTADGSAFCVVSFIAAKPGSIQLAATPDNIGINGGMAQLTAVVKDDSGNVVTGAEVSFRIIKGPGGGEQIDKPIIATTSDGIARAQLLAGTLPSSYRGCEIEARVGSLTAATRLTISGEPYTITVSRPEDDTVKVPNGGTMGENTFSAFVGAVVSDVNGNPVADGTPVNFSAVVSGLAVGIPVFERWSGTGTTEEIKPILRWEYRDIPFEDVNGNRRMDPGIDLTLDDNDASAARGDDVNGDGRNDYDFTTHDFKWFFNGAEPYWPASKEYITITDPNDARYRSPDTTVQRRVKTFINPRILSNISAVVYDTSYSTIRDTTVQMHVRPLITSGGTQVSYDTTYSYIYTTDVRMIITPRIISNDTVISYDTSYTYLKNDTILTYPTTDSTYTLYADLNRNGSWDPSQLAIDRDGDSRYDGPASGDFDYWRWELRPQFKGQKFDFSTNDFAVVIDRTVTTKNGVASTKLTYPRQFANRLFVSVNAETKGIRDRDGERFVLPIVR